MGYDSVEALAAFKYKREEQELICFCIQIGDSNLWSDDDKMHRSWNMMIPNPSWRVIGEICRFSSSCESGMLKYKRRDIKPEVFIKKCRQAIESAPLIDDLNQIDQLYFSRIGLCVKPEPRIEESEFGQKFQVENPSHAEWSHLEMAKLGIDSRIAYENRIFEFPASIKGLSMMSNFSFLSESMWVYSGVDGPYDFDTKRHERWVKSLQPVVKDTKIVEGDIVECDKVYTINGVDYRRFKLKENGRRVTAWGINPDGSLTEQAYALVGFKKTMRKVQDEQSSLQ